MVWKIIIFFGVIILLAIADLLWMQRQDRSKQQQQQLEDKSKQP